LGAAVRFGSNDIEHAVSVFDLLSEPWSSIPLGDRPPWPNDITDDGTPFEFSVALQGADVELRMLLESRPTTTAESTWDAGLQVHARLQERGLISRQRFDKIADLFAPTGREPSRFSLWHAAVIRPGAPTLFKAYVNPHAGDLDAKETVRTALQRLGLHTAWDFISDRLTSVVGSDIAYFSLDLNEDPLARVKIYLATSGDADSVEALLSGAANFRSGEASTWLETLAQSRGPFSARPILACFSFTNDARPQATLHVPVRSYVPSDAHAARNMYSLLDRDGADTLRRSLAAISDRALDMGRGLITYASLRPTQHALRLTAYLAPQSYAIAAPRPDSLELGVPLSSAAAISQCLRPTLEDTADLLTRHALFQRAQSGTQAELTQILKHLLFVGVIVLDSLRAVEWTLPSPLQLGPATVLRDLVRQLERSATTRSVLAAEDPLWLFAEPPPVLHDWAYRRLEQLLGAHEPAERAAAAISLSSLLSCMFERLTEALESRNVDTSVHASGYQRIAFRQLDTDLPIAISLAEKVQESARKVSAAVLQLSDELDQVASAASDQASPKARKSV
jgi:DMATS type aromatic prenyltransferase